MVEQLTAQLGKLQLQPAKCQRQQFIELVDAMIHQLKKTSVNEHHLISQQIIELDLMGDFVQYLFSNNRADQLRSIIIFGACVLDDSADIIQIFQNNGIIDRIVAIYLNEDNNQMLKFIYRSLSNAYNTQEFRHTINTQKTIQKAIQDYQRYPQLQAEISWFIDMMVVQ